MGLGCRLASVLALVAGSGGCVGDAFVCAASDQCVLDGNHGTCEPTGYCSFAAPECALGRRYGQYASAELRDNCVQDADLGSPDVDAGEEEDLAGADLTGADLTKPDLASSDLAGLDLAGADLKPPPDLRPASDLAQVVFCPTGAIVCDDFESGNTSKWSGPDFTAPSTISVDTVRPRGGLYSLHGNSPANGSTSTYADIWTTYTKAPPMTVSLRFWLYAQTTPGPYGLFAALRRNGTTNINVGTNPAGQFVVTQNDATVADLNSTTALPLQQWVCVQLRVDYPTSTASQGRARVFLGTTTVLDFAPTPLMTNGEVHVGLVRASGDFADTLFFDDVTAAYEDTPCP